MSIIDRIRENVKSGTVIPKPESTEEYEIKGWGKSRGEDALVYYVPMKPSSKTQSSKRIEVSDFESAFHELIDSGKLTRTWFDSHLPDCAKDGGCSFTTIGGIFELLGEATYHRRGEYRRND